MAAAGMISCSAGLGTTISTAEPVLTASTADRATIPVGRFGQDRFLVLAATLKLADESAADVQVNFTKGAKAWFELEIEKVDEGLKALHEKTGNDRLLTRANGAEMTFARGGPNGTTYAENHEDGRITYWDLTFTGTDPVAMTVVHEMGHNWDDGGVEGLLLSDFTTLSGWRRTPASTHTPADNGWHYQTNKANLFPMHNGGYAKSSPYEDIATGFEIYFYGNPSDREAIRPKLNALDALFASLA